MLCYRAPVSADSVASLSRMCVLLFKFELFYCCANKRMNEYHDLEPTQWC